MPSLDELSDQQMASLPLDRLALEVLRHLKATNEWNTHNFRNSLQVARRGVAAQNAGIEALNWLLAHGLIAMGKPGQSSGEAMIITRARERALADGFGPIHAAARLGVDLHPRLSAVPSQFLIGDFEVASFTAMKAVEIRVRELAEAEPSLVGTALMQEAFKKGGPLADRDLDPSEQVGIMQLYVGAIGTFKNPPSHRQVNFEDATEASEVVMLADLLLRMLDRTAQRIGR
jgi:uncharacterized protein (TIGR02391 family)